LSLLEVLVAMAIFLFSLVAIGRLITIGGDQAVDVRQQGEAIQLCQSKLDEVRCGALPLTSQTDVPLEEDPNWLWTLDAEQGAAAGLWNVTVRVSRKGPDGSRLQASLSQMIIDPSIRGATMITSTATASPSGSNQGGAAAGGGAAAAGGGAASNTANTGNQAKPATGGGGGAPAAAPAKAPTGGGGGGAGAPAGGGAKGGGGGAPAGGGSGAPAGGAKGAAGGGGSRGGS
jgi:type II secretory pathway pseudopilin PulG